MEEEEKNGGRRYEKVQEENMGKIDLWSENADILTSKIQNSEST